MYKLHIMVIEWRCKFYSCYQLSLVDCSYDSLQFKGESVYWKDKNTAKIDGISEKGKFEFRFIGKQLNLN